MKTTKPSVRKRPSSVKSKSPTSAKTPTSALNTPIPPLNPKPIEETIAEGLQELEDKGLSKKRQSRVISNLIEVEDLDENGDYNQLLRPEDLKLQQPQQSCPVYTTTLTAGSFRNLMRGLNDTEYFKAILDTLNIDVSDHKEGRAVFYLQALSDALSKRSAVPPISPQLSDLVVPITFEYAVSTIKHLAHEIPYFRGVLNSIGVFNLDSLEAYPAIGNYLRTIVDLERKFRERNMAKVVESVLGNTDATESLPSCFSNSFGSNSEEILPQVKKFLNYFYDLNDCSENWSELASYQDSKNAFLGKPLSHPKIKYRVHPYALFGKYGSDTAKQRYEAAVAEAVILIKDSKRPIYAMDAVYLIPEALDNLGAHDLGVEFNDFAITNPGLLWAMYNRSADPDIQNVLTISDEFCYRLSLLDANKNLPQSPRWAARLNEEQPARCSLLKAFQLGEFHNNVYWTLFQTFCESKAKNPTERFNDYSWLLSRRDDFQQQKNKVPTPEFLGVILKLLSMEGNKLALLGDFSHPCYFYHALMLPSVQADKSLKEQLENWLAQLKNGLPYAMQYVHDNPRAAIGIAEASYRCCTNPLIRSWCAPLKDLR